LSSHTSVEPETLVQRTGGPSPRALGA